MLWFIYNVLFTLGYILMLPRFLIHMARRGGYRRGFLQRLGIYTAAVAARLRARRRTWVHAVSVGEVYVALRFMEELRRVRPDTAFVLTTTTSTGHRVAADGVGDDDVLLYFPSDVPLVTKRVLDLLRPEAILLTECELWPNLVRMAHARSVPIVLINGRISDSSYRGYRKLRRFFGPVLESLDLLLVQTGEDGRRVTDIGAFPSRVHVVGSAKYDGARAEDGRENPARHALQAAGIKDDDLVLVGGSTWPGEESALLDIFGGLRDDYPRLRLVLVPRHAERRDEVETEIRKRGLACVKRTDQGAGNTASDADVLLVDTTGELADFYRCASVIFVGKSLTSHGGQNFIEAASPGKPVIVGPYTENFPVVTQDLLTAQALVRVHDGKELGEAVRSFIEDPALREAYGNRALALVNAKKGSVERSVELIGEVMAPGRRPAP